MTDKGQARMPALGSPVYTLIQLLRVSSLINLPMQEEVALRHDMSLIEMRIVMLLGGEGAMAGHQLATRMGIAAMNVSRALTALTQRGIVQRVDPDVNRRRKLMRLTPAGQKCFADFRPDILAMADFLTTGLGERERRTLARNLDIVIGQMEAWHKANAGN
jgi:DNA-binding MarR family transcriptional regulator